MRFAIEYTSETGRVRAVDHFPTLASSIRAVECRGWQERYAVRDTTTGRVLVSVEYAPWGRCYGIVNGRIRARLDDLAVKCVRDSVGARYSRVS